jgi:hypothetical protein
VDRSLDVTVRCFADGLPFNLTEDCAESGHLFVSAKVRYTFPGPVTDIWEEDRNGEPLKLPAVVVTESLGDDLGMKRVYRAASRGVVYEKTAPRSVSI